MDTVIGTALAFARKGHAVLPLTWPVEERGHLVCSCMRHTRGQDCRSPAKHPYGQLASNGLLDGTTDSGIIKYWFAVAAPQANLGVVTDGLVVVDVDPRHGGDESLAALEREHGDLPQTWRALTGGGGQHIIFAAPEGAELGNVVAEQMDAPPLGRGVDIRARGGYIVGVGSRHICGRSYHWSVDHHPSETPLAPPPVWLVEKLTARGSSNNNKAPVPSAEWAKLVSGKISEYRDLAAARLAGHLFRRWVDTGVVVALLRAWNQTTCEPPLPDDELLAILHRIGGKEAARIKQRRQARA
jgi:hypothetical protein